MTPTVSVIMPLYNSVEFMDAGIESVLRQTFVDLELIVIDDGSTDESLNRAHRFAKKDQRVRVLSLRKNGGAAVSRNHGIEKARGRYIAFLDSDDLWQADKLELQLNSMRERGAVFSYTDYAVVSLDGTVRRTVFAPDRVSYYDLLKNTTIGCSTVIYDRQALGNRMFPLIRKRQDLALWLSILRDVDFAHRGGPVLTSYRERPRSLSGNKINAARYTWRIYRAFEELPLSHALYYFARYAVSSVLRRL
ncbi:glycosyltransferase [Chelativorans sp. ZYF759]|uniref:glycosyltransferase family 2 protein n=1 Tax=Chelativorans sp. ZYF759 TaxID=2692213 RepID=UPI00145C7398|nr:glycosyltransferase family 2 protein [Chelativorans sp. ZYF759]NMG42015.1 glycosyltransferase [Chelativorans sp. ZYF759]